MCETGERYCANLSPRSSWDVCNPRTCKSCGLPWYGRTKGGSDAAELDAGSRLKSTSWAIVGDTSTQIPSGVCKGRYCTDWYDELRRSTLAAAAISGPWRHF